MPVNEIKFLEQKKMAIHISLWDNIEKAEKFYSNLDGIYTAYNEEKRNLMSAFSTPVKIYKVFSSPR